MTEEILNSTTVLAIVCARCGSRGIPTAANWCPQCGIGGNGWAQLDRAVLIAAAYERQRRAWWAT